VIEVQAHLEDQIDDLRRRIDTQSEERKRLTLLITDQRPNGRKNARRSGVRFGVGWGRRIEGGLYRRRRRRWSSAAAVLAASGVSPVRTDLRLDTPARCI